MELKATLHHQISGFRVLLIPANVLRPTNARSSNMARGYHKAETDQWWPLRPGKQNIAPKRKVT